jgi:hypothetical protein
LRLTSTEAILTGTQESRTPHSGISHDVGSRAALDGVVVEAIEVRQVRGVVALDDDRHGAVQGQRADEDQ